MINSKKLTFTPKLSLTSLRLLSLQLLLTAALSFGLSVNNAFAGPAVDGVNTKFSFEGGDYDNNEEFTALGSLTTPLGSKYGLQIDALLGERFDETFAGGGIHLFHRDPARYLIGLYVSGHHLDPVTVWRAALEFELYFNDFSLEGIGGIESIDFPALSGGLPVITDSDEHFFTEMNLGYYLTDNFRLTAGYRYENEESFAMAGAEYAINTSLGSYSLYARGQFGEDDFEKITGGIRWYFGPDNSKSLKRRHREDDPNNWVPDISNELQTQSPPVIIEAEEED